MSEKRDYGVVERTVHELLSTYDVTDKHYCINERGNSLQEVFQEVYDRLKKEYPALGEDIEYFNIFPMEEDRKEFPYEDRLCIFYVKGGSEGYYVHVESQHDRKNTLLFLGKTLREGEAGVSWAEKMVCALSRIMQV